MSKVLFLLAISVSVFTTAFAQSADPTEGTLYASGLKGNALGACPLKNTRVRTDISGFIARVRMVQEFQNDFTEPIEAVYTFPLSQNSAVDQMTMTIGERVINGKIMKRAAARRVYETAKEEGRTASLLDQERPNIFTQAVANIQPGSTIIIEISYVETLKYEDGQYEFVFPMVVAPRYSPVTMKAEEVALVSPPVLPTRGGHDISVEVNLDAGVPVEAVLSSSHDIETVNLSSNSAKITLKDEKTIPNRDFVLRYDVTGKRIEDALLTHRDAGGGFFTLILQPPDKFAQEDITPKEIVFVLDTSGSMEGRPIEKAKEAMKLSLDGLYPDDTFSIITFAGETEILFEKPVHATQANIEKALKFIEEPEGDGGTEMMKAIKAALDPSDAQDHVRIVCFMTDGEVGNDNEIIAEIQKHPKARVFSFGIGDSVNRFLLDKMAAEGNGEHEYVGLEDDGSKAAKRFYERVRTPLLTDISVDWGGLAVVDAYPQKIPDLFSAKPVVIHGRYTKAGAATVRLRGRVAGQEYSRDIAVNLPEADAANDVLAPIWARQRIDDLMSKSLKYNVDTDEPEYALKLPAINAITALALKFRLMTRFTSFVAVEDKVVASRGKPRTVQVPVEKASTSRSSSTDSNIASKQFDLKSPYPIVFAVTRRGSRSGNGSGSGNGYGYGNGSATVAVSAAPDDNVVRVADESPIVPPPPPIRAPVPKPVIPGPDSTGSNNSIPGSADKPITPFAATPAIAAAAPPKTISAGVINGKALEMVHPVYPSAAMAINAHGIVSVQVIIDESGRVVSAQALTGHLLLRHAAEQAAGRTTFAPVTLSGAPVKSTGIISYNFRNITDVNSEVLDKTAAEEAKKAALTPEQQAEADRRQLLAERLHFWVFAALDRLQTGASAPALNEEKFVTGGNANVRILVIVKTISIMEKLRAAGFEGTMEKGIPVGSIPVVKLSELAAIPEVKLILPRMR